MVTTLTFGLARAARPHPAKLAFLSLIASTFQMAASTDAQAAVIYGKAVGSFCCAMDANHNLLISSSGGTQFTVTNTDTATKAKITWGVSKNAGPANYFEFDGNGSNNGAELGSTTLDNLFQIGTFDYYNGTTKQDNIPYLSFDLDMSVLNGGVMAAFPMLRFDMSITNTNDPQCTDQACRDNARDYVSIIGASMMMGGNKTPITGPMDFMVDGAHYQFNLNGFAVLDASGQPMKDANGNVMFAASTLAYENTMTHAAIYGSITPVTTSVVPVPAAFWLFGSGFAGLAGLAFRKRK